MPPTWQSNNKRQQYQPDSIRTSAEKIDNMIKYIVGAVFPPFLIQTASAATTIDPAYKFGFNAGTHANMTQFTANMHRQKLWVHYWFFMLTLNFIPHFLL